MVEPLRHRQTKGAETDMFSLQPPRHISTLPLATVGPKKAACRDGPIGDLWRDRSGRHSITSLASASSLSGTMRPSALAALRLMTNSKSVGCSTGRSAGLAPFNILST